MIKVPNRLHEARAAIEDDQPVDFDKLRLLQALDLVIAGREFVEQAAINNEEWDDELASILRSAT